MSEKKISYLNRNFSDYRKSLIELSEKYYPEISKDFNDASIGSWMIDLVSAIGDNLSYHIDKVYNETNIDSAQQASSVYALARSNGFKIPGPKGAMTEVVFECRVPTGKNPNSDVNFPNMNYAPLIKQGTKLTSVSQVFEVMEDIDFKEQFDNNGFSNREIRPVTDANGLITSYVLRKSAVVVSGESRIFKRIVRGSDVKPFMEVIIPDSNVMNVESIIFKAGENYKYSPENNEFYINREFVSAEESPYGVDTYRFFEVNSLLEQYRWGDDIDNNAEGNQAVAPSVKYEYGYYGDNGGIIPTYSITKGQWHPLTQKFITEYDERGYLKIIFGGGESVVDESSIADASDFTKYQISKMIRNNSTGKLPPYGQGDSWTMFVKYRVGGGASSNIATGALNTISYLDAIVNECAATDEEVRIAESVKNTITVTNTIPSISGRDIPTVDEIKNMIKYNSGAQERCVTLKDYENRISMLPPRYGSPFRVGVTEENNKIMIYLLGINHKGYLTSVLPEQMLNNITNYLSMYRSINDLVEVKCGRIINLSMEVDLFVDKNYNAADVVKNVIDSISNYMNINKRYMGEDIFIGDMQKEISKIDGVLNLIDTRIYNEYGSSYSRVRTTQKTKDMSDEVMNDPWNDGETDSNNRVEIDLYDSDYVLLSDADCIFEIKYPERDIRVRVKQR